MENNKTLEMQLEERLATELEERVEFGFWSGDGKATYTHNSGGSGWDLDLKGSYGVRF